MVSKSLRLPPYIEEDVSVTAHLTGLSVRSLKAEMLELYAAKDYDPRAVEYHLMDIRARAEIITTKVPSSTRIPPRKEKPAREVQEKNVEEPPPVDLKQLPAGLQEWIQVLHTNALNAALPNADEILSDAVNVYGQLGAQITHDASLLNTRTAQILERDWKDKIEAAKRSKATTTPPISPSAAP